MMRKKNGEVKCSKVVDGLNRWTCMAECVSECMNVVGAGDLWLVEWKVSRQSTVDS